MKIAHFSDIHYCPKHLVEVDRCFRYAIDDAISQGCEAAVISGDITDHRLDLHSPAVGAMLGAVHHLASAMPTLILQGTLSHDPAGTLDVFSTLGARHPIYVADRIGTAALRRAGSSVEWVTVGEDRTCPSDVDAIFSCLPSVNKGWLAANLGADCAAKGAGEAVADLLRSWAPLHKDAGIHKIPTVIVSHGTVAGCLTEHGVPMAGLDHEFTTATLFSAGADAVMLGHIHKHQEWRKGGQLIAYPGSVGRLHFGEIGDKGYLVWTVESGHAEAELHVTPSKRLVQIDVEGIPDLDPSLHDVVGAHVRIRYEIDEEQRYLVDRKSIEDAFTAAGAIEVKVEGRIRPVQRARAETMQTAVSVQDKLTTWCEHTSTASDPLVAILEILQSKDPAEIAESVMEERS